MIDISIAKYFQPTIIIIVFLLSLLCLKRWQYLNANQLQSLHMCNLGIIIVVYAVITIVIGFRPLSSKYFGDTVNYAITYTRTADDANFEEGDWFFGLLRIYCSQRYSVSVFFTIIMAGYMYFALWGIYRIFKESTYGAVLFFLGAFSFFSYATNGIRNGLGASVFIAALSYALPGKRNYIISVILCFIAIGIHKSMALPVACLLASFILRNYKACIFFWFFSIILCIIARGPIEHFFSSLGFDDRLSDYISDSNNYASLGYKTGFRIDFLIYGFMPILLGYYILVKKDIKDNIYQLLISTYTLSNSFWIMLMNAAYSNRFAYLSWFLYPIVLAYPCFKMSVWGERQGEMAGKILLAHSSFTAIMHFIYYS